jgi:hypothetical protein
MPLTISPLTLNIIFIRRSQVVVEEGLEVRLNAGSA